MTDQQAEQLAPWIDRVHCMDARDLLAQLPDGSVDACVTDPPYGIDGGRGGTSRKRSKATYEGLWNDDEDYIRSTCIPIIEECRRVAKVVVLTPGNRWIQCYPRADDMGCFWQPAGAGIGPWGFVTFNPILYYGKDPRGGRCPVPSGRHVVERPSCDEHPCAKPMAAWTWLVEKASLPGQIVMDPFLGSGTTAVACVQTGRHFIGCDTNPDYCAIAERRIAEARLQTRMDFSPREKPRQEALTV